MKKRKLVAVLLAFCLVLVAFAGCSQSGSSSAAPSTGSAASGSAAASGGSDEIVTVKVSYPCLVIVPSPESVVAVEEAINTYLEEKGSRIRMDLEALDANNYATTIDMRLVGGEEMDLYMCLGDLATQVSANKLQPITQYVDTVLADAIEVTGKTLLEATTINGEVYAVPCNKTTSLTYYYVLPTEIAENDLGLTAGDTFTMDELTEALGVLHEKYPDKIVMGVRPGANGSPNNFQLSAVYGSADYYKVSELEGGICVVGDDMTIQNMYETEYFRTVCETAYEWNQAGYVNKDASVATEEGYDLVKADRAIGYIIGYGGYNARVTEAEDDTTHGRSVMYVPITSSMKAPPGLDWGVAYTSKNPEAACEALSLFYTDPFVMNTILCGVEGRDYIDTGLSTEEGFKVLDFPEGLDQFTVPYYAYFTCGIMGNEYLDWAYVASDGTYEDRRAANQEHEANAVVSPLYGFKFDPANVKTAVAAISNVESQYLGGLLTGELDPDEFIPTLVQAVKDAGIDSVIAEAQTQLDAWVASKS